MWRVLQSVLFYILSVSSPGSTYKIQPTACLRATLLRPAHRRASRRLRAASEQRRLCWPRQLSSLLARSAAPSTR